MVDPQQLTPAQTAHKDKLVQALEPYMPKAALSLCADIIMYYKLHLHIEVERKGRYGDYTPHTGKSSRISINHNLSPFEFLITFVHELAHHTAFLKYGSKHEPHGAEWKQEFKRCMRPFFELDLFPYDLKSALARHMNNPKYSQSADVKLLEVLKKYDTRKSHILTLSQLEDGATFKLKQHPQPMRRIKKLRTYILCESLDGMHKYRVHAMAEIVQV